MAVDSYIDSARANTIPLYPSAFQRVQNVVETGNEKMREILAPIEWSYVRPIVYLLLVLYAGVFAQKLPDAWIKWASERSWVSILVYFFAAYLGSNPRNFGTALLIAFGWRTTVVLAQGRTIYDVIPKF